MRTTLTLLALAGLTVLLYGAFRMADDPGAGLTLTYFVGLPVMVLSVLLLGVKGRALPRAQAKRERNTMLGVAAAAAVLLGIGLAADQPGLILAAAAAPVLGAVTYLATLRRGAAAA